MSIKEVDATKEQVTASGNNVAWMLEVGSESPHHSSAASVESDSQSPSCFETHYCPECQKTVRPRLWIYDRRWYRTEAKKLDCSVCKTTLSHSRGRPSLLLGTLMALFLLIAWLSL